MKNGYGLFRHTPKATDMQILAHRFAYMISHQEPIRPDYEIDHLCHVLACVNPLHLEEVTRKVNNGRSNSITARHSKQTHCIAGHAFDLINTYFGRQGRACRECHRLTEIQRRRHLSARIQ